MRTPKTNYIKQMLFLLLFISFHTNSFTQTIIKDITTGSSIVVKKKFILPANETWTSVGCVYYTKNEAVLGNVKYSICVCFYPKNKLAVDYDRIINIGREFTTSLNMSIGYQQQFMDAPNETIYNLNCTDGSSFEIRFDENTNPRISLNDIINKIKSIITITVTTNNKPAQDY
jgi:hypothetical protein